MAIRSEPEAVQCDDPSLWVDRYGDALAQFAYARLGRLDEVEDIVQETFLAAWRARNTFDERSSRATWLFAILRRKIADHYRQAGRQPESLDAQPAAGEPALFTPRGKWSAPIAPWRESPERLAENAEFWQIVSQCLATLPAHLAQAFQLREIGLTSIDELSRMTGISPQNVAVRLHRGRALLRQCLQRKWVYREMGE